MSARQHKDGVKDSHRNPVFMADLVYTFTGYKTAGAPSDTSKYREGKIEGTVNLPFDEQSTIAAYDNVINARFQDALDRMIEFTTWHLNPDKREWLIKALLDIVLNDEDIPEEDMFCLSSDGAFISKKDMREAEVFEYQPFLIGILHYILIKRAGKNSLGVSTLETITAKEKGQERRYTGHLGEGLNVSVILYGEVRTSLKKDCNCLREKTTSAYSEDTTSTPSEKYQEGITASVHQQNISWKDKDAIQAFSGTYYQLIVTNEEDVFDHNVVTVSSTRVLNDIPFEIRSKVLPLSNGIIDWIKTFPAIICRENTKCGGETDPTQMAVFGYIKNIVKTKKTVKIAFKPLRLFPQSILCDKNNAVHFNLNMEDTVTTLNISAWSIYKVNLFEAFDEAGLTDMPRPAPQWGGGSYY